MDLDPAVLQPWNFWRCNWFLLCWTKYSVCLHRKQDLRIWESAMVLDHSFSFLAYLRSLRWWEKLQKLPEQIMLPVVIGYVELCWHGNLVVSVNTTGVHVLWLQPLRISVCKIVPYKVNNYQSIMLGKICWGTLKKDDICYNTLKKCVFATTRYNFVVILSWTLHLLL